MEFIREHQLNLMLSLSAVSGILIFFTLFTSFITKRKKYSLIIITLSSMLLLSFDRLAYIYRGDVSQLGYYMVRISNYLVFATSLSIIYGFNEFLIASYLENSKNSKIPKILIFMRYFLIVGEIVLIISQFTNLYYYFDENNYYNRGSGFILCYIFPLIALIIQCLIVLKYEKKSKKRILIPLILFTVLPIIASIIQIFTYGVSLTNITSVGVVVLLYFSTIYDASILIKENERIENELQIASEIQINECPNDFPAFPDRKEFDIYATMVPAKEVGGDFYDYYMIDDNHLAVIMADVSGKGVPAALNMVKAKILLKGIALYTNNPAKVLDLLNDGFIDNNKFDMFVTVWLGILEISSGKLKFANAGHEDIIIYKEKTGYSLYETKHGVPIGAVSDYEYKNNEILLDKGDKVFLYTDGVVDLLNIENEQYGINNLLKVLNKKNNKSAQEIIESVKLDLDNYSKYCDQFDDITMLCLEMRDDENVKDDTKLHLKGRFRADVKEVNHVFDYFTETIAEVIGIDRIQKYYIVIDEIFSNIVKYGFEEESQENYISIDLYMDLIKRHIKIIFEDEGIPFNPLEKEDPNIKLSSKDREEGGLGIYIVKKMMDNISYEYKDNKNILVLEKYY